MLKVNKIRAMNVKCFRDFSITMPNDGLFYLSGSNEDDSYSSSNGSGKSTFMSLVPLALFGRGVHDGDKKKLTYKDYIRFHCRSAVVEIEIKSDTGEEYLVRREIDAKGSDLFLTYKGDVLQNQFAVDFIKDKLSLDFQSFVSSCLFGQGIFQTFMSKSEEDKMSLLEELFKLKEIDDIRKQLKEDYENMGDEFFKQSKELSNLELEYKSAETKYTLLQELYSKDRSNAERLVESTKPADIQKQLDDLIIVNKRKSSLLEDVNLRIQSIENVLSSGSWGPMKESLEVGKQCPMCRQLILQRPDEQDWMERQNKKQQEYTELQNQLSPLKKERNSLIDAIQELDKRIFILNQEKEQLEKDIQKAKELLGLSEQLIKDANEDLNVKQVAYSATKIKVDELQKKRNQLSELRDILGEKELRGNIVGNYLELINYYVKKYVSFLTNGELSVEFKFVGNKIEGKVIRRKDGYSIPYVSYSGGEKKRLDIAVFLAFSSVNRHVMKSPLNILLLDEVFDSLDEIGIEKSIELLQAEKDQFGLILATGHNELVSERFSNKISLIKKNGVTVLA